MTTAKSISKELIDVLVCPKCKGDLALEDDVDSHDHVLYCHRCEEAYPVHDGIAVMLPAELRTRENAGIADKACSVKQANIDYYVNREKERDKWVRHVPKIYALPRILDFVFKYLDNPKMKVLDAGGGVGYFSSHLHSHGIQPFCFDISIDCIQAASEYHGSLRNSFVADAENLPLRSNSFDGVCFFPSLHHLPNPLQGLREAYRVLKFGGKVTLVEPNARIDGIVHFLVMVVKLLMRPKLAAKDLTLACKKAAARIANKPRIEYQDIEYELDDYGRWIQVGETDQEISLPYLLKLSRISGFKVLDVKTQQIAIAFAQLLSRGISYKAWGRLERLDKLFLERLPPLNKYGDMMLVALIKQPPGTNAQKLDTRC